MWVCSKCGGKVESTFDVCWRCGTSYQGEEDPDFVTADESLPIEAPTDYLRLDPGKRLEGDLPEPRLELVSCFETTDLIEAQFVVNELDIEDILATLQNSHGRGPGGAGYSLYPCQVVVRAEDLDRARSWVEDYRLRRKARHAPVD